MSLIYGKGTHYEIEITKMTTFQKFKWLHKRAGLLPSIALRPCVRAQDALRAPLIFGGYKNKKNSLLIDR